MATIGSEEIITAIIDGNGVYPGDDPANPVIRIVRFTSGWGKVTHAIVYRNEPPSMRYRYEQPSEYVTAPEVIWTLDDQD